MRVKLKYVLPLAQMALAVVLLRWSDLWMRAAIHVNHMPGPAPAFTLLMSINAPVAVVGALWPWSDLWERVAFVTAVGAVWYWVALNVESWRRRRTILHFTWVPLRLGADLLAIALGACFGLCVVAVSIVPRVPWPWLIPVLASLFIWSLGLMTIFGRDLVYCVRRKSPEIGN
jgi:hypothetical protein